MGTDPNFDCVPNHGCDSASTEHKNQRDEFYTRGKLSVWELLEFIQRHYADDYTLDKEWKITIEETDKQNVNILGH